MPMYTVEVAVVGVTQIEVEAEDADAARAKAADCVSPLNVGVWDYVADWAVLSDEIHLAHNA